MYKIVYGYIPDTFHRICRCSAFLSDRSGDTCTHHTHRCRGRYRSLHLFSVYMCHSWPDSHKRCRSSHCYIHTCHRHMFRDRAPSIVRHCFGHMRSCHTRKTNLIFSVTVIVTYIVINTYKLELNIFTVWIL